MKDIRRYVLALSAACAMAIVVGGCSAGESTDSGEAMAPEPAVSEPSREIIRNADMALRVQDVRTSVGSVTAIAKSAGGRISSESVSASGEDLYANVTARVPADRLDDVIAQVGALGEVTSLSVIAEDVTAQGADLDARIAALETSIARLQDLLANAATTKDLIDIEGELTARQAELDALRAQRSVLSEAVALSTLSVAMSPSSEAASWTPPGFLSGLQSGWNALRTLGGGLVTLAGFLLPFVAVAAAIVLPIAVVLIGRRRKR